MRSCREKTILYVKPSFWILISLFLLTVPLKLVLAWITAAGIHELFHVAALKAHHVKVYSIKISFLGAELETEPLLNRTEFFCALAGPLGSILLILLYRFVPTIAFFAFVQTVSNTVPIGNRDGSRILRCILVGTLGQNRGMKFHNHITACTKWFIFIILSYICLVFKFMLPVLTVLFIYLLKIPCKAGKQIVQYKHLNE